MKMVRRKNKGFSLIELILVLGLSSLAFLGLLNYEKRKTESIKAESVGQQFEEVGKALSSYIAREGTTLSSSIAVGTSATIPLTVLQGTTSGPYIGREYLPATYSPTSGFGVNYVIQIRNNGTNLTGLVISNLPVTDESGQVRYDWIGYALRKAGSQAGSAFFTGASVTGLNGGWNITNAQFPAITTAGQIAYRSQYQNNYDDIYLRRDGGLPMIGNLNMGNFNIANATDISYNGWLYGNNALLNNLRTGYILNTGNMRNNGDIQTASINGIGSSARTVPTNYANFERLFANINTETPYINNDSGRDVTIGDGNSSRLIVKDILLSTGVSGRPINSWLSDRLPKYSSRGVYSVVNGSGVSKVSCGATYGVPKIEVIPQSQYVQGRVMGTLSNSLYMSGGATYMYTYQDQYSVGGFAAYALDYGSYWVVKIETPYYDYNYTAASALAHVYCDYGS